jgi:hypothetical protein
MAKSWLVRALVPGHLHVQGSRLLAMAHHLAHSLRTRLYDTCMDDYRRSAGCDPRTSPTSRLGRAATIIVFSCFPILLRSFGYPTRLSSHFLTMFALISFLSNVYYYSSI